MKVIKAWWWRDRLNLGDILTPYIIEHLSGLKCKHIGIKWSDAIIYILKRLYAGLPIDWSLLWPIYFIEPEHILGVGSILDHKSQGKSIAWGSGFLRNTGKFTGKKAVAVRGKFSADLLVKQGAPKVEVLGDSALLLPLIYNPKKTNQREVAIVPNFSEYSKFKDIYGENVDVLDLNSNDIEGFIDKLCSYSFVLSSSLHGLIIGHAYGIPVIWIEDTVLAGDHTHFKFRDYFSSVGIEYYEPYRDINNILKGDIRSFFFSNKAKYTFKEDIVLLQKKLLSVAPFPISEI